MKLSRRSSVWGGMDTSASDAAFTAFVDAEYAYLSRAAFLMTSDRSIAEDLLQEALVRTYRSWSRIEEGRKRAYCRRIMVNLATDRWRRKRFEGPPLEDADAFSAPAADAGYAAVDHRDDIARQLAGLSHRERAVLVLRYYSDLTEAEVARELAIPLGTVKSTAHRALSRLRADEPTSTREGRLS